MQLKQCLGRLGDMITVIDLPVVVTEAQQQGLGGKESLVVAEEEVCNQIVLSITLQFKLRQQHLGCVSHRGTENCQKLALPRVVVDLEATEVKFAQGELRFLGESGQFIGERQIRWVSLDSLDRLEGELDCAVRRAERFALTLRLEDFFVL
jgi:hypothetical protein